MSTQAKTLAQIGEEIDLLTLKARELVADRDRYKQWYEEARAENDRLCRVLQALRGGPLDV